MTLRGGAGLRTRKSRGIAQRYGLLKYQRGPLRDLRDMIVAFFASLFNPFFLVDTSRNPNAGIGFFFPGADSGGGGSGTGTGSNAQGRSSGGEGGGDRGKRRGERRQYGRNAAGERQELRVRTLGDLPYSSSASSSAAASSSPASAYASASSACGSGCRSS